MSSSSRHSWRAGIPGLRVKAPLRRAGVARDTLITWLGGGAVLLLVGFLVYSSLSRNASASYDDIQVFCTTCNKEFTVTAQAAAQERAAAGNPRKKLTCPTCKKEAGETMTLCDKCGQWYLPKNNGAPGERACSKCGHDPDKN